MAPILVVDTGSSPSLNPHPTQPGLGVSSRNRYRRSLAVKELNWTTSESSKVEETPGPQMDIAAASDGVHEELEREAEVPLRLLSLRLWSWLAST